LGHPTKSERTLKAINLRYVLSLPNSRFQWLGKSANVDTNLWKDVMEKSLSSPTVQKNKFLSALEMNQFWKKIKTHGLIRTLLYSLEFAVRPVWRKFWVNGVRKSYSQDYEDVLIDKALGNKNTGTYLDIGAFDPVDLSNTKRFYDRGWRGCNIEPEPLRFRKFVDARPEDINLNVGISDCAGQLVFFDFEEGAYSTFSQERAEELLGIGAQLKQKIEVPVISMKDIFEKHFKGRDVDFCSLDAEGMDLRILKSNDWNKFRPKVFCVELSPNDPSDVGGQCESVGRFLVEKGYRKIVETFEYGNPLNAIYVSEK
jgi:FkbM family methyltransferase